MAIFFKNLFFDTFWLVVYFPIWWYSEGLKDTLIFCWRRIKGSWRGLALSILFENFFKPMYGQEGWDAYILSLFTRIWQIFWRFLLFVIFAAFWALVLVFWLFLPPFAFWQLVN